MNYGIHLMFRSDFDKSLLAFKQYILKYGSKKESSFIRTLLWSDEEHNKVIISEAVEDNRYEEDSFTPGIEKDYKVVLKEYKKLASPLDENSICSLLQNIFDETINLDSSPDTSPCLNLYLYLPLYNQETWSNIEKICNAIKSLHIAYNIDIIGLAPDLAYIFETDTTDNITKKAPKYKKATNDILSKIIKFRKDNPNLIKNIFIIQNYSSLGLSLNLNTESFIKIIGEISLIWSQFYNQTIVSSSSLKTLGISILSFDKYYFIQYLLSRTYLQLMDNANISEDNFNVNDIIQITESILKGKSELINNIWENFVKEKKAIEKSIESIIPEIDREIDNLTTNLNSDLYSFLSKSEKEYSLPKKKVILASLLGLDDELIKGNQFIDNQTIFDDLHTEGCLMFVNAHNRLIDAKEYDKAVLSNSEEVIYYPLPEIKKIRNGIKVSTTYIRKVEKELKKLSKQVSDSDISNKRLTKDGNFIYEGQQFKLLPNTIEEIPLEETYIPQKVSQKNIDLSCYFPTIKNQGKQGSCSAFALTSVYEYMLMSRSKVEESLSEAFLYYNARANSNNQNIDSGASIFNTILTLAKKGICKEEYFPYQENIFDVQPPDEAYDDALNYLVQKSKNVNPNVEDIKSAISEGLPVIISLRIYDSFGDSNKGFIYRPSDEEIENTTAGSHAMVICGYSEDEKIFVVRNSWGNSFGVNGYCYIPYSYITDERFLLGAYIITEINHEQREHTHLFNKVSFDKSDANILYAITKVQLDEERILLSLMQSKDDELRRSYFDLIAKLRHPRNRNILTDGLKKEIKKEVNNLREKSESDIADKISELKKFKTSILKWLSIFFSSSIVFISAFIMSIIYLEDYELYNTAVGTSFVFMIISIIAFIFTLSYRSLKIKIFKKEMSEIRSEYTSRIYLKNKSHDELSVKYHIAGEILEKLFSLEDGLKYKYHTLESYLGNLKMWQQDELNKKRLMISQSKAPFQYLIKNENLDSYFENNKQSIIRDISLSDFINEYKLTKQDIILFQKSLKNRVIKVLSDATKDFSLLDYIVDNKIYPYLQQNTENLINTLPQLDRIANVFLLLTNESKSATSHKVIAAFTDSDYIKSEWEKRYPKAFSQKPVPLFIDNPNKLIIMNILDIDVEDVQLII